MKGTILDASALLALLNQETGHDKVQEIIANSVMSSVNIAEVASILFARHKVPLEKVNSTLGQLVGSVVNFNERQAYMVAELEALNRQNGYGLALGDKCCIALGAMLDLPVYTADKVWKEITFKNVQINLIR